MSKPLELAAMRDCNGEPLRVGSTVMTVKNDGGCIGVGKIGTIHRIRPKPKHWPRARKYPTHADVRSADWPESGWAGWFDPIEIALVPQVKQ